MDYWERQRKQWYDKRLTRRQISTAIKDPEAKTEIVSHSPNLLRMGSEEKVWKNISQDVCLFKQPKDQHRKYVDTKSEWKMQILIFLQWKISELCKVPGS